MTDRMGGQPILSVILMTIRPCLHAIFKTNDPLFLSIVLMNDGLNGLSTILLVIQHVIIDGTVHVNKVVIRDTD